MNYMQDRSPHTFHRQARAVVFREDAEESVGQRIREKITTELFIGLTGQGPDEPARHDHDIGFAGPAEDLGMDTVQEQVSNNALDSGVEYR